LIIQVLPDTILSH